MNHQPWCENPSHAAKDGCSAPSARVGDVGLWLYVADTSNPVVILDPQPDGRGLTLTEAHLLAEELEGLVVKAHGNRKTAGVRAPSA